MLWSSRYMFTEGTVFPFPGDDLISSFSSLSTLFYFFIYCVLFFSLFYSFAPNSSSPLSFLLFLFFLSASFFIFLPLSFSAGAVKYTYVPVISIEVWKWMQLGWNHFLRRLVKVTVKRCISHPAAHVHLKRERINFSVIVWTPYLLILKPRQIKIIYIARFLLLRCSTPLQFLCVEIESSFSCWPI